MASLPPPPLTKKLRPLADALAEPRKNRDMTLAVERMPNFTYTKDGPKGGVPLEFSASWTLASRPRRIALLLDDCQEEYRLYAQDIIPNLVKLVEAFRSRQVPTDYGVAANAQLIPCIAWSSWSRAFDDGISNAMDRWYGPHGLIPDDPENAIYVFQGPPGLEPLREISPTDAECQAGWHYHGQHLDMFWTFVKDQDGQMVSYLDEKLKAAGIDTVVIGGLWTDECILATCYGASSRGYDVVLVGDAVATATAHQQQALSIVEGTCGNVVTTDEVVDYMSKGYELGTVGAVKGVGHPDGRKD